MANPAIGDIYRKTTDYQVTAIDTVNDTVTVQEVGDATNVKTVPTGRLDNWMYMAPPVVNYGVGQTVRDKISNKLFAIGNDGYFDYSLGAYIEAPGAIFTSTSYVLVNVP